MILVRKSDDVVVDAGTIIEEIESGISIDGRINKSIHIEEYDIHQDEMPDNLLPHECFYTAGQFALVQGVEARIVARIAATKTALVAKKKTKCIAAGYVQNGKKIHTDSEAIAWLNGMYNRIVAKGLANGDQIKFNSREGDKYRITVGTFKTIYIAITDHLAAIEEHAADLIDALEGADTVEDVAAVDVSDGWPE